MSGSARFAERTRSHKTKSYFSSLTYFFKKEKLKCFFFSCFILSLFYFFVKFYAKKHPGV